MNRASHSAREEDENVFGFSGGCRQPQLMRKTHQHHELEINFLLEGSMTYLIGGSTVRVSAGRFAVLWAAAPHQVVAVEGKGEFYWFTVPFPWVLQWGLATWFIEALFHGRMLADRESEPDDVRMCARWLRNIGTGQPEPLRIAQLEIEARLRRLILAHGKPRTARATRLAQPLVEGAAGHVQRMVELIARQYTEPLTVADIARPTRLHPNYAMVLFRANCGLSMIDYLVQHRLFHARRLLVTTNRKILVSRNT